MWKEIKMIKVKFIKALYPFNKWDIGEVEESTYEMFKNQLELIEWSDEEIAKIEAQAKKEKEIAKKRAQAEAKKGIDWKKSSNKAILKPKTNK